MLRKLFKWRPLQKTTTKNTAKPISSGGTQTDNTNASPATWFMMGYLLAPRSSTVVESSAATPSSQPLTSFQTPESLTEKDAQNQPEEQQFNQSTVVETVPVDKGGSDWWSSEGSSWDDSGDSGGGDSGGDSGGGGCD